MALQQLARNTAAFGLKWQVSGAFAGQFPSWLGAASSRAYASVEKSYKYTDSHEWVKVEGDVATIGISHFAQGELGEVVYVELAEADRELAAGESFGVVESVKAASDVYSPVSGVVVASNEGLTDEPGTVNNDPYYDGWLIKVKLSNKAELDALLDADAYEATLPK